MTMSPTSSNRRLSDEEPHWRRLERRDEAHSITGLERLRLELGEPTNSGLEPTADE
jgi:hypothetical protein